MKILMIDDHPSQIEGYKTILSYNRAGHAIETTSCYNCREAYELITKPATSGFDMVFLDQCMPSYEKKNIRSGEDLVPLIKKHMPGARLVVLTSQIQAFVLYNMVQQLNPDGVLVKSDFDAEQLLEAFECIAAGGTYHSETVAKGVKELLAKSDYLDAMNRKIILFLSQGVKTKHLPEHIHLSLSAIEKRKAQIRDYFCLTAGKDQDIVVAARTLGFV
jgi:two-component system, NarL family, response regulator NreC